MSTRPLALFGVASTFLLLALACGGKDGPDPTDEPSSTTPSLGDLLNAEPATTAPAPTTAPTPSEPPPLPDLSALPDLSMPVATEEPEFRETAECTSAREALRAERQQVDARRAREVEAAERSLASGQLAMQNCIKTRPCNEDAKLMADAQEKEEAAEAAYQAALERVGRIEAGLYEYEQAVDRACGRR